MGVEILISWRINLAFFILAILCFLALLKRFPNFKKTHKHLFEDENFVRKTSVKSN